MQPETISEAETLWLKRTSSTKAQVTQVHNHTQRAGPKSKRCRHSPEVQVISVPVRDVRAEVALQAGFVDLNGRREQQEGIGRKASAGGGERKQTPTLRPSDNSGRG